jgi:hypothetical protein
MTRQLLFGLLLLVSVFTTPGCGSKPTVEIPDNPEPSFEVQTVDQAPKALSN